MDRVSTLRFAVLRLTTVAALAFACSAEPAESNGMASVGGNGNGGDPSGNGGDFDTGGGGSTGDAGPRPGDARVIPVGGENADAAPPVGDAGDENDARPLPGDASAAFDAGPPPPDARPPTPDGEAPYPDGALRPDRGPPPPNCTDDDLDGYSVGGCTVEDCDDQSSDVYPFAPEVCDGLDNDCDGIPDDDYDFQTNVIHCGGCGISCLGQPVPMICVEGACVPTGCRDGTWDLDGDPSNGCEYQCVAAADGVERCNGVDDDCDGGVDEDAETASDPENCGACGRACDLPGATAACVVGLCVVGACDFAWYDVDGDAANGCEYACLPTRDGVEHCDLVDNDCDGSIDEDEPERGFTCPRE